MKNAVKVSGLLLVMLLGASGVRACAVNPQKMFNGRVAVPKSLVRECSYAWQQWQKHPGKGRPLLRWAEMWSAPATDNVAPQDLRDLVTQLGYQKTDKKIHSTDAVFQGSELYFEGKDKSFLVVELFFVGDRMNVLI
ncbi:hypothetical protein FNU79_18750, partial [Deinococcus detaillensis]